MPTWRIHSHVAKRLVENGKLDITNKDDFIYGSIMPDIPRFLGTVRGDEFSARIHCYKRQMYEEYKNDKTSVPDAELFVRLYGDKIASSDFTKGMYAHIATDKVFNTYVYARLPLGSEKWNRNGLDVYFGSIDAKQEFKWNDLECFATSLDTIEWNIDNISNELLKNLTSVYPGLILRLAEDKVLYEEAIQKQRSGKTDIFTLKEYFIIVDECIKEIESTYNNWIATE